MAESRRVQLTTLSCDGGLPPSSEEPVPHPVPVQVQDHKSPSGVLQERETGSDRPACTDTVRLVLTLFEPDERSFPEFSYSELLDNKITRTKDEVPLSRFEEEEKRANDEVAAISRKLEEKYGGKPKKKDRIQDLIDIGYGYDDEDSFIDNSEAYDEFVPASITTKFGGFYVNSGVLQFRHASETEDLTTEEETLESSKKRKVNGKQARPKKRCRDVGETTANADPKSSTLSEVVPNDETTKMKKKKKAVGSLSVTSMLKKFQREKEKDRQKTEKAHPKPAAVAGAITIPLCPADAGGGGGSGLTDPLLSLIGSTNDRALIQAANTVDFDIDLDSLLDVSEGTFSPKAVPQHAAELSRPQAGDLTQSDAAPVLQPPNTKTCVQLKPHSEQTQLLSQTSSVSSPHQGVPLPDGLPPLLEDSIRKLIVVAKTSEGESKLKFFTPEINSILLDIELQCREQGGQLRSKVYTHLSSFLPCSRDTLLKRVKKLLLAHMGDPVQKLKEAIGRAMPEQVACFRENCHAYEQVKKTTEAETEGHQKVSVGPEDGSEQRDGKRGGPKKLFKWNEEVRESLFHMLQVKVERYKKERKGSPELEEYLKTLLESEVKPLWPKGWMQSGMLIRESRKMLSLFTSLPVKRAKPEKKPPSITGLPAMSNGCTVLQESPPLTGLPQETDDVLIESSNSVSPEEKKEGAVFIKVGDKTRGVAAEAGSSSLTKADKPLVSVTSTPTHSPLDLLADQALAKEQPLSLSQQLLAAAVAKYRLSVQRSSFGADTKSPPFPPPPPHSSPVGFPLRGVCQMDLPQLRQVGEIAQHTDADDVQIISDDDDVIIQ